MFLKEYRYMLDHEEKVIHAVLKYGEGDSETNIVNVFLSQDVVDISKQFDNHDFGYKKESGGGYHIKRFMENGVGTGGHLDNFMRDYVMSLGYKDVEQILCDECETNEFETISYSDFVWCKKCCKATKVKRIKLK